MFLADDERDPQFRDVDRRLEETAEIEELRFPVGAVVMMDWYLGYAESGVLDLLHHLETNHAAGLLERDLLEDGSAQQTEVAVDIAHVHSEKQLHPVVIEAADHDPVQGIRTADLISVDEVDVVIECFPQPRHLRGIVLGVALRVEHQLASGRLEAALQCAAVAAVASVVHDLDL